MKNLLSENKRSEVYEYYRNGEDGPDLTIEEQHSFSSVSLGDKTQPPLTEESVTQKLHHLEICANEFPGSSATYRILEVTSLYCPGSGVSEAVLCTQGGTREAESQSNF